MKLKFKKKGYNYEWNLVWLSELYNLELFYSFFLACFQA